MGLWEHNPIVSQGAFDYTLQAKSIMDVGMDG